jgi:hypothetical protein
VKRIDEVQMQVWLRIGFVPVLIGDAILRLLDQERKIRPQIFSQQLQISRAKAAVQNKDSTIGNWMLKGLHTELIRVAGLLIPTIRAGKARLFQLRGRNVAERLFLCGVPERQCKTVSQFFFNSFSVRKIFKVTAAWVIERYYISHGTSHQSHLMHPAAAKAYA